MRTAQKLIVFRHGQTDWNAAGRIQGHLDVPLNEIGREQARRLIAPLQSLGVDGFLSSDLSRAYETALIAARPLGLSVDSDPGLREIHLGKLEGLTKEEIEQKFGETFSDRIRHQPLTDADVLHLGCESGEQVVGRALAAIRRFVLANPQLKRIGICTHGGVVRRLIQVGSDLGFPPPTPNGVLYSFDYDEAANQLRFMNFTQFFSR